MLIRIALNHSSPRFSTKKKSRPRICIKDIRIFTNSITKAVSIMKTAGFAAKIEQNITETVAEYRIVIPLEKKTVLAKNGSVKTCGVQTAI